MYEYILPSAQRAWQLLLLYHYIRQLIISYRHEPYWPLHIHEVEEAADTPRTVQYRWYEYVISLSPACVLMRDGFLSIGHMIALV